MNIDTNKDIAEAAVKALVEENIRLYPKYWKPGKPLEYLGEDRLYYSFSYDGVEIGYIKAEKRAEVVPRRAVWQGATDWTGTWMK